MLQAPTDGSVLVEAVRIGLACNSKEFELHVKALDSATRGSKRENVTRLQKFKRPVVMQKKPNKPTAQQIEAHAFTHEPYEPWCELCVQFHARQDKHPPSDGTKS